METFELTTGNNKAHRPATFKQIQYLKSFENVQINCSSSQIIKRLNSFEISQAIVKAKEGIKVIIN